MKPYNLRSAVIVASLFITLFIVFGGGYNAAGVFFAPMLKDLRWSSTRLSSLQTALALTAGITAPLTGWIIDRVGARLVMSVGVALAGLAFLLISRAQTFGLMFAAYVALGAAVSGATLLPCAVVIANWFGDRRGAALGITMSGTSLGGMVMTLVAARIIATAGWRAGFVAFAVPVFFIVLPLVLATVSTRPATDKTSPKFTSASFGLDIHQAVRAASFWMIAAAQFCYSLATAGAIVHTVPYLILMGYHPGRAAQIMSLTFALASIGKPLVGYAADYLSGRAALAITLLLASLGQLLLLGARNVPVLLTYVLVYGLMSGAPLALIPMVIADSLGLKRFGSVAGVTGVAMTIGAAAGPLMAGWIVDRGFGYATAFTVFAGSLALGAATAELCFPLRVTENYPGPTFRPS
jgi:MFS family permease